MRSGDQVRLRKGLHPGATVRVTRITSTSVQFRYVHPKGGKEGNRYSKPLDWFRTNMQSDGGGRGE